MRKSWGLPVLKLSDEQLDQVFRAARPLRVRDRDAFLQMIADRLRDCPEPGDGQVFQVVREAQRALYDPPLATEPVGRRRAGTSKYA
jgi:hypothetical protein